MGAPIAQLAGPYAELVPAVDGRQRVPAGQGLRTREHGQELRRGQHRGVQSDQPGGLGIGMEQARMVQALRRQPRIERGGQRRERVDGVQFGQGMGGHARWLLAARLAGRT
ncbi:hypothetical protein D3C72_2088190 [compost metagenome]